MLAWLNTERPFKTSELSTAIFSNGTFELNFFSVGSSKREKWHRQVNFGAETIVECSG